MRYTVPIVIEKALEFMEVVPCCVHYAAHADINGFSTYTRERRREDILWLNDNSSGQRPCASCGARHFVHIASRAEEAEGVFDCDPEHSLIMLPHTVQMRRLVLAMERSFAFYNAWNDALFDALRRADAWDELLEIGHRVLMNPMIIFNRSMGVLAYTAEDNAADPIWSETVKAGTALVDTARESSELLRLLDQVEKHDAPFRHTGEGMSNPFWCAPVQTGGKRRGMVNVVEYHSPLSRGRLDLLRVFADCVTVMMQHTDHGYSAPDAVPRQLMEDLLNGEIASREQLNARLIAMDWQALNCFCFVSLRPALPYLSGEQWKSIYYRLSALDLNDLRCMIDRGEPRIALLLTSTRPELFARPLDVIGQFCALNHVRAGISDVYCNLLETPRFYRQSDVALELGDGEVCPYDRVRNARMLRHLRNHPYPGDLMHPAVIRLAALDREEGSEYIETFRALFDHGFNQLETAEALNIHRTTLAYRLRRAQELTGLELSGEGQLFHIAVSLKLMETQS